MISFFFVDKKNQIQLTGERLKVSKKKKGIKIWNLSLIGVMGYGNLKRIQTDFKNISFPFDC